MTVNINGTSGVSGVDGTAGTPALQGTDSNTGISFGTDTVNINTGGTTRATVDSSGRVGIGTTSPSVLFEVSSATDARIQSTNTAGTTKTVVLSGNGTSYIGTTTNHPQAFITNDAERARIDTSGRLLVGTTTGTSRLSIEGTANNANSEIQITATGVASGYIGSNSDGLNIGTDTAGIVFKTGVTGGGSVGGSGTERMRIASNGDISIGRTTIDDTVQGTSYNANRWNITTNSALSLLINRQNDDGTLVQFRQANADEGSISVSGTTVSYNGAHLSRWSQLPSGAERTEILRGSVLSNIDEMCEWSDEENEQLNRMKVSDVEGDKNVSGVFQAWDDDDDTYTNDFYCAMTGDFVIRIGAGVTVERGDLLMSAGDGTAKPQDDDIIRSKTIAKVTSTNVSCTYDDGSYCVPCVLMAC